MIRTADVSLRPALLWIVAAPLLFCPASTQAFVTSDGTTVPCTVQTAWGPQIVPEYVGYANGFLGYTQMGPNGLPMITFDHSKVAPLTAMPAVVDFLFYHECAHARFATRVTNQYQSELVANCEGLRAMRNDGRLLPAQVALVGQFHAATNVYAQYFGSGANLWNMTLACAAQPPSVPESVFGQPGG